MVKVDPFMRHTFSKASLIACTTPETKRRIPNRFHSKCIVLPAIGIDPADIPVSSLKTVTGGRFLFIGRLLYWKGLQFALRALSEVHRYYPDARLKVIGKGRDSSWLKSIAEECGVMNSVEWISRIPYHDIAKQYENNIAFVFPSLRDSGGMVLLEAFAGGIPVICLNLGGPGVIVNSSCGIVIDANNADETKIVKALAEAMTTLIANADMRQSLALNALSRVRDFGWDSAARELYSSTLLSHLAKDMAQSG
jgi:glycosyltransferase involved in cell wall biosynthesis